MPEVRVWAQLWVLKTHMKHHFDFNPHVRRGFSKKEVTDDEPDVWVSAGRRGTIEFAVK